MFNKTQKTTAQILSNFKQVIDDLQNRVDQINSKSDGLIDQQRSIDSELKILADEKGEAHKAIQQFSKIFS